LKVIIDQVWSHTASVHPWFLESREGRDNPRADWYVWAEPKPDGSPPNNWQSWMGGAAWTWESRRKQYYLHNFLREMPDLNFHCPAVQGAILDVAHFWLKRGVDGFRLDTANFYFHSRALEDNPPQPGESPVLMQAHIHNVCQPENLAFLARVRGVLEQYDARMSVAEIGSAHNLDRMIEYTAGSSRLHTAYSFLLLGDRFDPAYIAELMVPWQQDGGAVAWPSWAFSNHDVPRVASRWADGDAARCRQLIALLMCLRGTVFLYQGEELGLTQSEVPLAEIQDPFGKANWPINKGRDGCRTPLPWKRDAHAAGFTTGVPWLSVDNAHRERAIDQQESAPDSTLNFTRRVLAFRRAHVALRFGSFEVLRADAKALVVVRRHAGDAVLAAFNLSAADEHIVLPSSLAATAEPITLGDVEFDGANLWLPAWSALMVPIK
jgi:alpha-glucosidase